MRILLLGSGGREHALAWKMAQSPLCEKLFIVPGNAGTAQCGVNVNIAANNFDAIGNFCLEEKIDMLIPGPEEPLVLGIYDYFKNNNLLQRIPVIGPSKAGAELEGSKAFAKAFMQRYHIPTAAYRAFDKNNFEEGKKYLQQQALPIVLKADGLAAGKGVVICESHQAALQEFEEMIQQLKFGDAGKKVVVEEFLSGIELSVFVLTDGKSYLILPEAKDYKRIGKGDTGLNTGGMGAVSPVPFADKNFMQKVEKKIIQPTINGLIEENINYTGFIFLGLIKVDNEPFVIEYNCRLGDPETEAIIPRLKNDLVELFLNVANQQIYKSTILQDSRHAATIILVSGGYPEAYQKEKEITQLFFVADDQFIFHAGTKMQHDKLLTNGGRVLAVTSLANNLKQALTNSRETAARIQFEGKYFREDIGWEFI